jgi:hypothetical protein
MQEETPLFTSEGTVPDVEQEYSSNNERSDIIHQHYNEYIVDMTQRIYT